MGEWHDINLLGYPKSKDAGESGTKRITGVEDYSGDDEKPDSEVKILEASWVEGPKGFQYNEQCFLDVKVEMLKKTARKRIRGMLYGIYGDNNEEIDLSYEAEGFIDDKTETARLSVKYLFFINDDHYKAWQKDPSVKARYIIKGINHTLGENTIDSPILEIPASSAFDNDLFLYSPADAVYYRIANKDVDEFYQSVDECNKFVQQMQEVRDQIPKTAGKVDESTIRKLGDIKDGIVKYLSEQHEKAKGTDESSAMGSAEAGIDSDLKELVALNKKLNKGAEYKGWVYVRSDKIRNHWRKTHESKLIDLFGPEEKKDNGLKKEIEEKFREKILKPLKQEKVLLGSDEEKDILAPKWTFKTGEKGSNSDNWDFSAGAQFLRFSAGASLKSEVNLKNLETKVEAAGSVSFALAEGKTKGSVYLPDKNGFDIVGFLIKTQDKLKSVYCGKPSALQRTALTPDQRALYLRMEVGFEASGFVGASASIAFPRLEIKPVKGDDPKSERVALATLEGKAFAGAKAEGKFIGNVKWAKMASGIKGDWKAMLAASLGGAVSAGASAEAMLHFGYKDGHIRFACSLEATFVVGGKVSWDFDIGLTQGLEFLSQLALCVDFHFVAIVAEDLYEIMGAYKYAMLISPETSVLLGGLYVLKDIDDRVETAKQFVKEIRSQYQQVTNFVDSNVQNGLFGVDRNKRALISKQVENIKKCPPESIARYLLVVMKVPENDDYVYITEVLNACESDHKVRWVVRFVGLLTTLYEISRKNPGAPAIVFKGETFHVKDNTVIASNTQLLKVMKAMGESDNSKEKNVMLEKGAEVLRNFGLKNNVYSRTLLDIFEKNGI